MNKQILRMAIDALKRQKPADIIEMEVTTWIGYSYNAPCCPSCGKIHDRPAYKYCPYCGQRLNIGDEHA